MKRSDLIKCIQIGYKRTNEKLPIKGNEAQYAWEFGDMMKVNKQKMNESEIDEYLEEILYNSGSELKIKDLI